MTLSQRIIKKWLLPPILCVSMIFTFFPQSEASAEYLGANWFATEDGKWDGTVTTTSYYNTVQLGLGILYKINRTSGHKERYFDVDPFRVRLCNKNTGNCTNYKPFSFLRNRPLCNFYKYETRNILHRYYRHLARL